jgi:hypothetical protein
MTSERALEAIELAVTLTLAAASWVVVVRQMIDWNPLSCWRRSFA